MCDVYLFSSRQHQGTPPQPRYSPRSTMQHYPTYQEGVEGVGGVYYQPQPTGYPHQWSGPMTAGGFPSPHGSLTSLHGTTPPGPGLMVPQAVAAPVMPQHPPPMQPVSLGQCGICVAYTAHVELVTCCTGET